MVIGGYVVRDPALPSFAGRYLFGRFDSGNLVTLGPGAAPPAKPTGLDVPNVSGFGEDGAGHLYATSLAGEVYRLGESGGALTKTSIGTFDQPVAVAAPPGDPDRLFVVEQPGRVQLRTPAGTSEFLDISGLVQDGGEQGLLALAVSPDYAATGRVFVFYTDNGGDLQLDEYRNGARIPVLTIAGAGCCCAEPPRPPSPPRARGSRSSSGSGRRASCGRRSRAAAVRRFRSGCAPATPPTTPQRWSGGPSACAAQPRSRASRNSRSTGLVASSRARR